ncbi:MAG TPA: hydrogenase 3 maturation endopeptidase HyCI [Polyangiaceae bacterium]|nr:hydrogenase 3 maturation endopeptidase HyCI [Polyangiaceae bacterium]
MAQRLSPLPRQQLHRLLTERLQAASSVALLCVGAELRGDDGVGMRIGRLLDDPEFANPRLRVHFGSSAPENCTGPIREQAPSHLLIIDAAHLGAEPGAMALLERDQITGVSFCTHALPLNVIVDFIAASNPQLKDVLLLGIQPQEMGFDEPLTTIIEEAAQAVAQMLRVALPTPT